MAEKSDELSKMFSKTVLTVGKPSSDVMRAVQVTEFGGPEVLKYVTNVTKPQPGENQVLIRVKCVGVNPGDTFIRLGTYGIRPPLPFIPGIDAAGVVEAVGPGVTQYKKGDRVFTTETVSGACAEYTVSDTSTIGPLPDCLSFEQGACLASPYFTAYNAVATKGQVSKGQTVLVHGASGGVGMACVQICRALGATVLGTAGSKQGMDFVTSLGAKSVFNHREEGYTQKIMEATGMQGPDVILEMMANANLNRDVEIIGQNGRIVIVGGKMENASIAAYMIGMKRCIITGAVPMLDPPEEWVKMHSAIQTLIKDGWIKPHVSKTYRLEDTASAHDDIANAPFAVGKRVIVI